jgi:DNA-binding CsgD family transcriptional regulator
MMENLKNYAESLQMQNLVEEARTILENSSDLNRDKYKLKSLLDEIMHWTKDGDQQYEDYYKNFCETITAMVNLDFSKRLPELDSKTLFSFMTLGLNVLNEELFQKVVSTKMLHSLLDGLDLKNKAIILTNATAQIIFVHSGIKNAFFSEDVLVGQPMSVVIEDLNELDEKFKNQGFLKGIDVKIKFEDTANRIVKLHLAIPTLLLNSEGIAYILTLSEQQLASINNSHKTLQEKNTADDIIHFENNCLKFELTPTEKKIACLLVKGYNPQEIAHKFYRSPHTVSKHLQNMFVKVGVKNKNELVSSLKSSYH